jgi:regulatory protein
VAARAGRKAPPDLGPDRCHDRALRLLSFRSRSTREMTDRLTRAGFPDDVVVHEIDRLTVVGLLDDEAFAQDFTRSSVNFRKLGRRSVRAGLMAKGVDRGVVEEATASLTEESEQARADELAQVRARRVRGKERVAAFNSLAGFLMRRGFDPSVARRAAGRALAVDVEPD